MWPFSNHWIKKMLSKTRFVTIKGHNSTCLSFLGHLFSFRSWEYIGESEEPWSDTICEGWSGSWNGSWSCFCQRQDHFYRISVIEGHNLIYLSFHWHLFSFRSKCSGESEGSWNSISGYHSQEHRLLRLWRLIRELKQLLSKARIF